jgi:hypothetical protein
MNDNELALGRVLKECNIINSVHKFYQSTNDRFSGIDFRNKIVLDIGGGSGLYSFYSEIKGAKKVVCLEPLSDGSNNIMMGLFKTIKDKIKSKNVFMINDTIQNYITDDKYDIVISQASINHLDEIACLNLNKNRKYYQRYLDIFEHIYYMMNNNGYLIISDVSNRNFWGDIGIRNPFVPDIEWKLHHSPKRWSEIALLAGFKIKKMEWRATGRLIKYKNQIRYINKLLSYLLASQFDLYCIKKE